MLTSGPVRRLVSPAPTPTGLLSRRGALLGVPASLAVGLGGVGCAAQQVSLREGPREYVPYDYEQILQRWTRSESLVPPTDLDNILNVTATFESWDFRWAYVVRYASDYRLTMEQRRKLLESTLADSRQHHQFFVALYGPNHRWNDLTKKTSAWIVRLIDDRGNESAPEDIIPIRKPGAIEQTYFPYTGVFRQVFRIRFPSAREDGAHTIAESARWFGLRFAGAQGNTDVRWEMNPSAPG
jgi:hypothetical protein